MAAIHINDLSFSWPDGTAVFSGLDLAISPGRTALLGDNGSGKSTLLRLIAGELVPVLGSVRVPGRLEYLPQELPLRLDSPVDELLGIATARQALRAIESGDVDEDHFATVGDDWDIEERARGVLDRLGLDQIGLDRTVATLSGGESMLVGLAARLLREPSALLLDEPTNNLDIVARRRLYQAVDDFKGTLLIVSHDRALLSRVDTTVEMRAGSVRVFGGNLEVYETAIEAEQQAARRAVRDARADMNKQKQELIDTQVKLAHRERFARKAYENKREPRAVMKLRKRAAQVSAAKLKNDKQDDLAGAKQRLGEAEDQVRDDDVIRVDLPDTEVPAGRDVLVAKDLAVDGLFSEVDVHIRGSERVGLLGANGSGKTTLLRVFTGARDADRGTVRNGGRAIMLPQRLEILDEDATVLDNVWAWAPRASQTFLRTRLARFLFRTSRVHQPVATLSGGERLRTALAAVLSAEPAPQLLALDEPTNNLDMTSTRQLREALQSYRGALIVVSHDMGFLREVGVTRWLRAERGVGVSEVDAP